MHPALSINVLGASNVIAFAVHDSVRELAGEVGASVVAWMFWAILVLTILLLGLWYFPWKVRKSDSSGDLTVSDTSPWSSPLLVIRRWIVPFLLRFGLPFLIAILCGFGAWSVQDRTLALRLTKASPREPYSEPGPTPKVNERVLTDSEGNRIPGKEPKPLPNVVPFEKDMASVKANEAKRIAAEHELMDLAAEVQAQASRTEFSIVEDRDSLNDEIDKFTVTYSLVRPGMTMEAIEVVRIRLLAHQEVFEEFLDRR